MLFDTHCHLQAPELVADVGFHLAEARHAGVQALLVPAIYSRDWPQLLQLCQQPRMVAAVGIHPWACAEESLNALEALAEMLHQGHAKIKAVGETGLDYSLPEQTWPKQEMFFRRQIALATEFKLPLILHHRHSQLAILSELKRQNFQQGGILHAFSGSTEQGQAFVKLGFKLGIGGTITYARSQKTRKAVAHLPLSSFVLETDAPAMPLAGFQGQPNTPAQLKLVFDAFCQLRSETPAQIAAALWQNSTQVLQLQAEPQKTSIAS